MKTTKRHDPVRGRAADRVASSSASGRSPCEGPGGLPKVKRAKRVLLSVRSGVLIAALGTFGVAATIGTFGSWPSLASATEPTAAEKLADLKHLGLGADGLLAAGLTVTQAAGVLDWVGEDRLTFDSIQAAHAQLRLAESVSDGIRAQMVRIGRTQELDADYAAAQTQVGTAQASYDALVAQARTALGTLITEELNGEPAWPMVSRVIDNRARAVPVEYRVLNLTENQWDQIELYHAMLEKRPEALDVGTVTLGESLALDSAVVNAQARVAAGIPTLVQSLFGG